MWYSLFGHRPSRLPCVDCKRGQRKGEYGQWVCQQNGFRPKPISLVKNCKSLNDYLKKKKK